MKRLLLKKRTCWAYIVFVLVICVSVTVALEPMGPACSQLTAGQFSAGAEYSCSRMDVKLTDGKGNWQGFTNGSLEAFNSGKMSSTTIENLNLPKVYANLGYGITDNWQISVRLGAAQADFNYKNGARPLFPVPVTGGGGVLFDHGQKADGDSGFSIGIDTKATFYEKGKLKIGGLFQISWSQSDGKRSGLHPAGGGVNGFPEPAEGIPWSHSVDTSITEIQFAMGPTYRLDQRVSIYGGPFFHFIDGNVDGKYSESGEAFGSTLDYRAKYRYDIDENSFFGGYVGLQFEVFRNGLFNIEYQHTAFADALGMQLIWRF